MEKIGLIAGGGKLPVIFAQEARKKGEKVVAFAIKGMTSPELGEFCDKVHWLGVNQIPKFLLLLVAERLKKIAMLGKVDKSVIYKRLPKKKEKLNLLEASKDKSDYGLLDKITREFEKRGVKVINGIEYLQNLFPPKGVLTKKHPSKEDLLNISFGFKIAREMARLDVGQTVVVKDKTVISAEAMEGTDQTIERAAKICKEGFVVIKVSRPNQDMRWDVPVVGPDTVKLIVKNKGSALAFEEKKMFIVEKETCVKLADDHDISLVVI